jgi:hypothetical protein
MIKTCWYRRSGYLTFDETTPQVPGWLYKLSRNRNEQAMNRAAFELHQKYQG